MCKTCELNGIDMKLDPLDLSEARTTISMPKAWDQLIAAGFHEDLIDRAYAHMAWSERTGDSRVIGNARAFLSAMGKGFLAPFDPKPFRPHPEDPYFEMKTQALQAIDELSLEFGDRVSSVTWDSLAHLATRAEPEEKRSILKEAATLPHHYGIVDTMLHALGKVYTLFLRTQSVFYGRTGMVLVHNCDCNCSLLNLKKADGAIRFSLSAEERREATQSLFTHQLAESQLILNNRLPFEYSITGDARALLGVEA